METHACTTVVQTGIFHVGYLGNDTSIANTKTHNFIHYSEMNVSGNYSIVPGGPNKPVAIFDGSVISRGIDGEWTLLYTDVSGLPIHWTLPYRRGGEAIETLDLTTVVDGGVLEVHTNSRFVLSTWARSWYVNSTNINFFQNGNGDVSFSNIHVADGLYKGYPERIS